MKASRSLRSARLILLGSSMLAATASGTIFYWDNNGTTDGFGTANGTWAQNSTTGGRWTTSSAGTISGNSTQFTDADDVFNFGTSSLGLAAGTITVSGTVSMGNTTFGSASGAILLTGGTINFGTAKTITVNNATNTIASTIGAAATSLTKAGSGTLVFTANNSYTGTTNITGGVLIVGDNQNSGTLGSGNTSISSGAELRINRLVNTSSNIFGLDYSASLSGSGTVNILSTSRMNFTASAAQTSSANLTFQVNGVLGIVHGNSLDIRLGELTGSGTIQRSGSTSTGAPTLRIGDKNTNSTFSGTLGLSGGSASGMSINKVGTGTLTLSGTSNYTGTTTVTGGTLLFGRTAALYNSGTTNWTTSKLNVKSGATLAFRVGGTNEFTTASITTLLTNLADSSSSTDGMNAGSNLGFDTTNASGGTFTIADVIANTTGTSGGARGLVKLGTGTLVLTNTNTNTGVTIIDAGTLEVQGSIASSSSITNNFALVFNSGSAQSYANAINGNGTLTKSGTGTLTLSGGGSMEGNVIVSGGTVQLGATNGISTSAGLELFGGASATRVLNLNGYNQTLSRFVFMADNSSGNLTINGSGSSKLTINTTTNTELGAGGAVNTATKDVTVNMSGLNEFEWNGSANTFRVGMRPRNAADTANTSNSGATGNATVTLAATSTITAATLAIGTTAASNNGGTSVLLLGQSNALNASTINMGTGGRNNATLEFNTGLTNPTATIRGTAGGTSRVTTWDVGRVQTFGDSNWDVDADFSAGQLDARVTTLSIGRADTATTANRAGTVDATFSMGKGTLDVTTLIVGQYTGTGIGSVLANGTLAGNAIFNLNDPTGTVVAESIILGDNLGTATLNSGSEANVSGTFNLLAGTLEAGSIGKGADTGNATSVTRDLNFTSGTIRNLAGNDLTISGVPINLIGTGTRNFEATEGQSITIAATADIAGTGTLTKIGTGTFTITSAVTYTGGTVVDEGTMVLAHGSAAGTGAISPHIS